MSTPERSQRGPPVKDGELVLDWNEVCLDEVRENGLDPATVTRLSCLVNVAVFDAVNGINRVRPPEDDYDQYAVEPDVSPGASRPAAANAAAYNVLNHVFGSKDRFDDTFQTIADTITRRNVAAGVEWGEQVAKKIIALRENDGHNENAEYDACTHSACADDVNARCSEADRIGCYRKVPWGSAHLAELDRWSFDPGDDGRDKFRPDGPPPLDSEAYAEGLNTLKKYGDAQVADDDRPKLSEAHDDPVGIATFWFGSTGTTRPSGRWSHIAVGLARDAGLSLTETTRMFAHLSLAVGEAGIATWEAKHHYGYWRPRAAIHNADQDGNAETAGDPEWTSIAYGGSPEYPSGLAAFGGAAKTVLVDYLGNETGFDLTLQSGTNQDDFQPVTRSYDSFTHALEESIAARIYVGNHFLFTLTDSREIGEEIGAHVLDTTLQPMT